MPIRARANAAKGLPPNLYVWRNWYRYRHPVTGQYKGMGGNRKRAVNAALQLNSIFMTEQDLVAHVMGHTNTLNEFLETFWSEVIPERKLAKETLKLYQQKCVHIRQQLGNMPLDKLQVKDIAQFLSQYPPRSSNQYRAFLSDVFKYAIARGLCSNNPAASTIPKKEHKQRIRMTLEGYKAIYEQAEPWLRNAMALSLQTLQRREDIAAMRFDDVKDGYLYVVQQKTEKHGEAAHLKIKISAPLQAIIDRCRDSIVSPYFVHRLPVRKTPEHLDDQERTHLTQCLPDFISKQLKKARDKSGYYNDLPVEARPGFHEIRSLGSKLYKDAGIDPQALLGHTSAKMTKHYLEGHELQWTEVSAGLAYQPSKLKRALLACGSSD